MISLDELISTAGVYWSVCTSCVISAEHIFACLSYVRFIWTYELRKCRVITDVPMMCTAGGASKIGIKKRHTDSVSNALVDVQCTRVTRTGVNQYPVLI